MTDKLDDLFHRLRAAYKGGARYAAQNHAFSPAELNKAAENYAESILSPLALAPAPTAREGWRSHDGMLDPDVAGDTLVEVCFRDGDTAFGLVHDWDQNWQWADSEEGLKAPGAIIAWRPHTPSLRAGGKCPHCNGTGDASEKGRIEECLACHGTGKPALKPARWEVQRPSDGAWVLVAEDEARRFEGLGRRVRALYPVECGAAFTRSAAE